MTKRGFTLMEVNLAVFIMAVGVLAMVALYPLGFRESQQSREDVAAADMADAVLNPLVAALSWTNMHWTAWKDICKVGGKGITEVLPDSGGGGWYGYCKNERYMLPKSRDQISGLAKGNEVIGKIRQAYSRSSGPGNPFGDIESAVNTLDEMGYALVVSIPWVSDDEGAAGGSTATAGLRHDYSRIALSFRATHRAATLFSQPIFYTEVHFQGNPDL